MKLVLPWNWAMKTRETELFDGKSSIKNVSNMDRTPWSSLHIYLLASRYHAGRTTFKILVWDDLGNWGERKQKDELARMNLLSVYLSIYHVSCFSVYVSNTQLLMNCALMSLHPYFMITLTNLWSSNMAMENPPSTNVFRLYTFQRLDFP